MANTSRYAMEEQHPGVVRVARRIDARPESIFAVLSDPVRHAEFDGSGMLRGSDALGVLVNVGDTFLMKMCIPDVGDYTMLNVVVDYELNRRIAWEPRPGDDAAVAIGGLPIGAEQGYRWIFDLVPDGPEGTVVTETFDCSNAPSEIREAVSDGESWLESMSMSLEKLSKLFSQPPS
jgi:uncharacterized protein YndB with AHSA1/START domain